MTAADLKAFAAAWRKGWRRPATKTRAPGRTLATGRKQPKASK